ncbi:MAG: ABC-type transport auxiliary lipoprotein family protein [Pseudomonadota bacterium]|nr:ABC-type transport auxiliary lipoprotein family protein [Pseudomonadota bacterium]MDO7710999.1 ABC-type transport auxiliary lipoprotein family protein [Pseudomonadota bacterium]
MAKPYVYRVFTLFFLVSMLSGCFGFGSKEAVNDDSPRYYMLDAARGGVASEFAKDRVLLLKPVRVTSLYRGKTLIFRVGDNEYRPQPPHQFFTEPSEMITEQLRRWLQKTGLFSQVVITDDVPADMILEAAATALYGEQRDQFSPQAVLEMQFFLMSNDENNTKPLFQTGLRVDVDIEQSTPENVVKGWKQGLEELFSTLEDDFSGYFTKLNP